MKPEHPYIETDEVVSYKNFAYGQWFFICKTCGWKTPLGFATHEDLLRHTKHDHKPYLYSDDAELANAIQAFKDWATYEHVTMYVPKKPWYLRLFL